MPPSCEPSPYGASVLLSAPGLGVVASATSNEGINQRLQRLQGPVLGQADLAQPLPLLKAQAGALLDQAQLQIAR